MNFKNLPLVSIIVATKNEKENIANCLSSVKSQTYPQERIEIVVVDNNSLDETKKIAGEYTNKIFNFPELLDLAKIKNFRGAQLNFGIKKSRGEIIFYPDADMTFAKKLLAEVIELVEKNNFEAFYIPETIVGKGIFGRIRNFERSFYNQTAVDAIRIVKRKIFEKIGGYDEKSIVFGADDWDLTKRIKKITNKITITENKLFHHEEKMDWQTFLSKKKKYVDCFDGYIIKWGKNDSDVKKQLGLWYRSVVIFTENGKWKRLISHPILALGMYLIRFVTWLSFKTRL